MGSRLGIEPQQVHSSKHPFRDNARVPDETILSDRYAQCSNPPRARSAA
jgi:hypothetical protein